ncbi:MAG: hypothetical protein KC503_40815, partial [Myxococcales bacterium]|nr:hypothetical protein [Myxococcales bacterium]
FFHAQRGEYRRAVEHLARSLEIAPTYAVAHEYLGHLQCEAGLAEEGVRRIELATRLEPTLVRGRSDVARHHALHGRYEAFETAMREAERLCGETAPLMVIHIRVALWRGDFERAERYRERLPAEVQYALLTRFLTQYAFGEIDAEQADATFSAMQLAARANPRLAALAAQAMAEMHGVRDEAERALAHVVRAADGVLTDIDWLDHCPVLARARTLAGFDEARRRVERRALDIWTPRPRL